MVKGMKTSNILEEHSIKLYIGVPYADDFAPRPRGHLFWANFPRPGHLLWVCFFQTRPLLSIAKPDNTGCNH